MDTQSEEDVGATEDVVAMEPNDESAAEMSVDGNICDGKKPDLEVDGVKTCLKLIQVGRQLPDGWKKHAGFLKGVHDKQREFGLVITWVLSLPEPEMREFLRNTSKDPIDLSKVPYQVEGDSELKFLETPVECKQTFEAKVSLMRLAVRGFLDSMVATHFQNPLEESATKIVARAKSEAERIVKSTNRMAQKNRKKNTVAKAAYPGIQLQMALLHQQGKLPSTHERFNAEDKRADDGKSSSEYWPFALSAVLELGGYTQNGTVAATGRNPSLVTQSEIRVILLELEAIMNTHTRKLKAQHRLSRVSSQATIDQRKVKDAVDRAKSQFGGYLPSEVHHVTMSVLDPDAVIGEEPQRSIAGTVKELVAQSYFSGSNNRSKLGSSKYHFYTTLDEDPMLVGASYGAAREKYIIEKCGLPCDCVHPQGRAARIIAKLDPNGPSSDRDIGKPENTPIVLMDEERMKTLKDFCGAGNKKHVIGPMVIAQHYPFSKDFERALLREANENLWVCDGKQPSQGLMRAVFAGVESESNIMPITYVGKSKGIVAVKASKLESALMKTLETIESGIVNCSNHFTCKTLSVAEPRPDIGLPLSELEEYLSLFVRDEDTGKAILTNKQRAKEMWASHYQIEELGVSLEKVFDITEEGDGKSTEVQASPKRARIAGIDKRPVSEVLKSTDLRDQVATRHLVPGKRINLILMNARRRGGFSEHQDSSSSHGHQFKSSMLEYEFSGDGKAWPTTPQMVVSTVVACNESHEDKTLVTWVDGCKASKAAHRGCVLTGPNVHHIQMFRANSDNLHHCATSCDVVSALNVDGRRLSFTARGVRDPHREPDQFLRSHALDGFTKGRIEDPKKKIQTPTEIRVERSSTHSTFSCQRN